MPLWVKSFTLFKGTILNWVIAPLLCAESPRCPFTMAEFPQKECNYSSSDIISIGASVLWDSGYILFLVFLVGDAIGLRQMPRVVTSSTFSFIFEACRGTASFWALVSVLVDVFFVSIPAISMLPLPFRCYRAQL